MDVSFYEVTHQHFRFVILFLMMSCFGGCGYYKHRQRLVTGQPVRGHRNFLSILTEPYSSSTGRVLTVENAGYPESRGYVFNRGPDPNLAASMAPPPYTEVHSCFIIQAFFPKF